MKTRNRRPRSSHSHPRIEGLEARTLLANAGTLDPSFGAGRGYVSSQVGKLFGPTSFANDTVTGVFTRPDGKVVVALVESETTFTVIAFTRTITRFLLERFNADGSPDATFGQGGPLTVPVPFDTSSGPFNRFMLGGGNLGFAVAMQPDGKILAGGAMNLTILPPPLSSPPFSTFAVIRVNVDGTLDSTYGKNGLAVYPPGVQTAAMPGLTNVSAMALQPNGQLVLAGGSSGASFAAVRLNADGSLDPSFGTAGTTSGTDSQDPSPSKVAIQPNGGIVVAGTTQAPGSIANSMPEYSLIRLDASGKIDNAFGGPSATGGVVTLPTDPTNPSSILSIGVLGLVAQPDNKIVLSTDEISSIGAVPFAQELHRLNADGTTDAAFGQGGLVRSTVAGPVAIQADSQIVVGGSNTTLLSADGFPARTVFAAARFHPDGSTDASFGNTSIPGLAQYNFGSITATAGVSSLAIQPDGTIVLAGATALTSYTVFPPAQFGVARVLGQATTGPAALPPRPTPPASFDGSGRTDLAVYLSIFGVFAYRPQNGFSDQSISFGIPSPGQTIPAAADYFGTGRTQIAAYLPATGTYAIRPPVGPDIAVRFGVGGPGGSIPAPADYEGTGRADLAVYIPSQGVFGIRPSTGGPDKIIPIGIAGPGQSIPAPGDYEGIGKADVAVYLPASGSFAIRPSTGGPDVIIPFGVPGMGRSIPAPGDYDGSGRTELAVYIPSEGVFAYRPARGEPDVIVPFGIPNHGSIPVPGDYSGSGHTEIAIYDPNFGIFAYRPAGGGPDVITQFGSPGFGASLPLAAPPGVTPTPPARPPVVIPSGPSNITIPPFPSATPSGPKPSDPTRRVSKGSGHRASIVPTKPRASVADRKVPKVSVHQARPTPSGRKS